MLVDFRRDRSIVEYSLTSLCITHIHVMENFSFHATKNKYVTDSPALNIIFCLTMKLGFHVKV